MSICGKSNVIKGLIKFGDISTASSHIKYNVDIIRCPRTKMLPFFEKKPREATASYCPSIWHVEGNIKESPPGFLFGLAKSMNFNGVNLHY